MPIQREIITPLFKLTAIGGLPEPVRERFGIPWGAVEAAELKALELWVRETWRFMPRSAEMGAPGQRTDGVASPASAATARAAGATLRPAALVGSDG